MDYYNRNKCCVLGPSKPQKMIDEISDTNQVWNEAGDLKFWTGLGIEILLLLLSWFSVLNFLFWNNLSKPKEWKQSPKDLKALFRLRSAK